MKNTDTVNPELEYTCCPHIKIFKNSAFYDNRGKIATVWDKSIGFEQYQTKFAISKKNVLRGFHGELYASKLICCVIGKCLFKLMCCRYNCDNVNKPFSITLKNAKRSILIGPEVLIANLCLSNYALLSYHLDRPYNIKDQVTVRWNDSTLGFRWPIEKPILSHRDAHGQNIIDIGWYRL